MNNETEVKDDKNIMIKKNKRLKILLFINFLVMIGLILSTDFIPAMIFLITKNPLKKNALIISEENNSDYVFNITQISVNSRKELRKYNGEMKKKFNEGFHLKAEIISKNNTRVFFPQDSVPSCHKVTEMIDDKGKQLFYDGEKMNIKEKGYYNRISANQFMQGFNKLNTKGTLNISAMIPSNNSKNIQILKGYIIVHESTDTKKLKLEKLASYMKPVDIGNIATFQITLITNQDVHYNIKKQNTNIKYPIAVTFYSNDDKLISYSSQGGGGSNDNMSYRLSSSNTNTKPAYAIIDYISKFKTVKVPFEFKNIPLP